MRYHLERGKLCNEFIISFIIAKDYFSLPAFTSVNNKKIKGFQWGKATVKVSLLLPTPFFIIPRTVLLSSIQPEAETLDLSTHAFPRNFRKSSHHMNSNKGSVVKQSGNDVEGC